MRLVTAEICLRRLSAPEAVPPSAGNPAFAMPREAELTGEGVSVSQPELDELAKRVETLEKNSNLPILNDPPRASSALVQNPSASSAIDQLNARIAASTPSEALAWTQVRAELLKQDDAIEDRRHIRSMEKQGAYAKLYGSLGAVAVGAGLIAGGFTFPGLFCLGAGLTWIAPEYVSKTMDRILKGGHGNDV